MAIRNIRLGDEDFKIEEWLHWPEYSMIEGAAGVPVNLRAFSYVVSQLVPQAGNVSTGKRRATESDTNRTTRARMNRDESMIIFSLTYEHFAYEGTTHSDEVFTVPPIDDAATAPILWGTNLRIMQRDLMFDLMVGANISKPMAQSPMSYIGQGIGAVAWGAGDALNIANGAATSLNLNYATAGRVSPHNQRRYQLPIQVDSDRVFHVRVYSPAGALPVGQDWQLKLYLDGLKRRPVA